MAFSLLFERATWLGVLTGVIKEAVEVDLIDSVIVFLKADLSDKGIVDAFGGISYEGSEMDAAKINEIESCATEDEYCLTVELICGIGYIADDSALVGQLELGKTAKFTVNGSGVGKHIGLIFYVTESAKLLLFFFGLNGQNFKHFSSS